MAAIVAAIRGLEAELDAELARDQLKLNYTVNRGKVEFEQHVLKFHKQLRAPTALPECGDPIIWCSTEVNWPT